MSLESRAPGASRRLSGVSLSLLLIAALIAAFVAVPGAAAASLPVQAISTSAGGSCAIQADGTLSCWGDDSGITSAPGGTFTRVAVSLYGACGIQTGGSLVCWGNAPSSGMPTSGTFTDVSAGEVFACAIRSDGTLSCWGSDDVGQLDGVPSGTFTQVDAGPFHSCAIRTDQTLVCFGAPATAANYAVPSGTYTDVTTGSLFSCAIKTDSSLVCFGSDDNYGQISNAPTGTFTQVDAGDNFACAVRTTGALVCWGQDLGGDTQPPSGTFTRVSAGRFDACGIRTDGTVTCWGDDFTGQLDGSPPEITTQPESATVDAGQSFTLHVTATGNPAVDYQWYRDTGSGFVAVPGATGSSYTADPATPGDTGKYRVDISNVEGTAESDTATVTVVPTTDLSVQPSAGTYGGTATLSATLTSGGSPVNGKTISFSLNGTPVCGGTSQPGCPVTSGAGLATLPAVSLAGIGAGSHEGAVQASFAGDASYVASSGSAGLTVSQKALTLTANDQMMTYGGQVPHFGARAEGLVPPDSVDSLAGLSCGASDGNGNPVSSGTPAGRYSITCSGATDGNYAISYVAGTLTIQPAPLTITAGDASMTYGGPVPTIAPSYQGLVNGDPGPAAAPSCGTAASSSSDVGLYATSCAGAQDPNYTMSYRAGTLTITPAAATVMPAAGDSAPFRVDSPGGTASFQLSADITGPGVISSALPITYTLTPIDGSAPLRCTDTNSAASDPIAGQTLTSHCNLSGIPVNVYALTVTVGGKNYTGSAVGTVTVYDPSLGFTTGGGTVQPAGSAGTFALSVKYGNNGDLHGSVLYVQTSGKDSLHGDQLTSLSIVAGPNGSTIAYIRGQATVQGVDGYHFLVTAIDGNGSGPDRLGLSVTDPSGQTVNDLSFDPTDVIHGTIEASHT